VLNQQEQRGSSLATAQLPLLTACYCLWHCTSDATLSSLQPEQQVLHVIELQSHCSQCVITCFAGQWLCAGGWCSLGACMLGPAAARWSESLGSFSCWLHKIYQKKQAQLDLCIQQGWDNCHAGYQCWLGQASTSALRTHGQQQQAQCILLYTSVTSPVRSLCIL
jgi:hypothetical protein